MTDGAQDEQFGVKWRRLQAAQLDLRRGLAQTADDGERERLKAELLSTRQALRRMEAERKAAVGPDDPLISRAIDPLEEPIERPPTPPATTTPPAANGHTDAVEPERPPTPGAGTDDPDDDRRPGSDRAIDDLLEELVYRHERPPPEPPAVERPREPRTAPAVGTAGKRRPVERRVEPIDQIKSRFAGRSRATLAIGAIVAAVIMAGLFVGVASLFWSLGASTGDPGAVDVASAPAPTPPNSGQLVDLRQALGTLGLAGVEAELRGSVLLLTGTVASEDDRQRVIDTAQAAMGDAEIDAESLQVSTDPLPATVRVALVAPGPRDDMAFTQSMVDALEIIAQERGQVELAVADNTGGADAAAIISDFAIDGYDLVIAHSSTFRTLVSAIAAEHPDVTFAVGPVDDEPALSNVYTYTVAAEQGGFVLGALAARLSATGVIGAVGPVETGVSERYVQAFEAGAVSERPEVAVLISYTGTFSDAAAAASSTAELVAAGADVITGQGHDMGQAIATATAAEALWLGNQVNQASVAPTAVVASQVYHWEVVLRAVIADIDAGVVDGRNQRADLTNGGVAIELNPDLAPTPADRDRIDALVADVSNVAPASG